MFTWICPQCGREVPPSYTECPDCAARTNAAAGAGQTGEAAAAPPQYPPPPPLVSQPAAPVSPQSGPPAQPPYPASQNPPYYPPQPYPAQQYPPQYPPQAYPPYPPQQYANPTQQYPPQQYPPPPYPPQYTSQYGQPQYTTPYPPPQAYPPPPPARPDAAPAYNAAVAEPPVHAEPAAPRIGSTLFGAAPVTPAEPAYAPPPPPPAPAYAPPPPPRADVAPAFVPASAPPEPSHEPGAPRAGGMLFGPPVTAEAAPRRGLPTWLMTILFAGGLVVVIGGLYWLLGSSHAASKPSTTVESPAAQPGAPTNVWQKYIEVSGVRFAENAKKEPIVKFVLTNHAGEEAEGLAGNVTLWGRTRKSEEDAAGTFTFNTTVPANGTKDLEAPLVTKLKIYELPDWQYLSTDLQITAPGGSGNSAAK
jgi:hypothetical protein